MTAKSKWLDFHTHFGEDGSVNSPFAVVSISVEDVDKARMPNLFTIGLHPWQTDRLDSYRMVVNRLPGLLAQRRCLALGEVGVDRLRGAPLPAQQELLALQLRTAETQHKPVVFHCVRAWSEMLSTLRAARFTQNCALHGFQGSCPVLPGLLDEGWFISVKPRNNGTIAPEVAEIPLQQILIETDAKPVLIADVYRAVAQVKQIPVADLLSTVTENAQRFFGINPAAVGKHA
ncbi:MAG: hypothetical protein AL399_08045 [Candidatus [Bacteroides] periocalifornicus]|uniref:Hydrolase TatD n=1 Tax=Candidatus [Bacteroides] periocalifornicus TaxID=1702214 RepID=A0A0Q4B7T6_9BACT|nr:MAG: hypothetical protein AL399_08045 [Candidatus [Bacteroides] periocalifornicus]